MRDNLKIFYNKRIQVSAVIKTFAFRRTATHTIETICLKNICDINGNFLASHIWIDKPHLKFNINDVVNLTGRVIQYTKHDKKNKPIIDYALANIIIL